MVFNRADFFECLVKRLSLVHLAGADEKTHVLPRKLLQFLRQISQRFGHRLRARGAFVAEKIAVLEPDNFAAAKERESLQRFANFAECLQRFAAVVHSGVDDFVIRAAQLTAPLLIDFFGALLDSEFVFTPDERDRG